MRTAAFALVLAVFLLAAFPVIAVPPAYNPRTQEIAAINRIDPLQNPEYEESQDLLKRRMLDRKNKVVGSVRDIVINGNGSIAYVDVDFDRMNLGRPVFVSYGTFNVKPVANGYAMTFDAKEIEELYPTLLAGIETAAGEDDAFSVKKMKGLEVWTASGRRIGTVNNVLFGAEGQRAELLYVSLSSGNLRGQGVAIPFGKADYDQVASQRRVTVPDDFAEAMIAFAKGEK